MIPATLTYQEAIRKAFRGQTHVRIEYGVEDKNKVYSSSTSPIIGYSATLQELWENKPTIYDYGLLSQDYMRTNGKQIIAPNDSDDVDIKRSGCIINKLSSYDGTTTNFKYSVTLTSSNHDTPKEIFGFVMRFDEINNTYPTKLDVNIYRINGSLIVKRSFDNLDNTTFVFDEEIQDVSKIEIEIHKINKGNAYLRLTDFMLGVNKIYGDKDLLSNAFSYNHSIDLLSNELSFSDLTFNVNNLDMTYNPFNLSGVYKKFDVMQQVLFYLGLEISENNVEWLKVATLFTEDFSFEDTSYSVQCTDLLSTLSFVNYFTPNISTILDKQLTYKDIIDILIANSGGELKDTDIKLIPKVANAKVLTSLPAIPCNELLQLIANINQCVVFTNRDGVIEFKDAFIPKVTFYDNGKMEYSSVAMAYNTNQLPLYTYAQLTSDYMKTKPIDWQVIRPDDVTEYLGYVSSMMCDASGVFNTKPKVSINYSMPTNIDSLYLVFDHLEKAYPKDFVVRYYGLNNRLIDTITYSNNTLFEIAKGVDYNDVVRYEIEITNWSKGNRRAVINRIGEGVFDDYYLNFGFMYNKPKINKLEYVKDISCKYHKLVREMSEGQPMLEEIGEATFIGNGKQAFYVDNEYDGFEVEKVSGIGTISNVNGKYSNACYFEISGNIGEMVVKLKGYKLKNDEFTNTIKLNQKGKSYEIVNPLCTTMELAQKMCQWYNDYVKKGQTLSIDYRGDYRLEPFDYFYVQSQYQNRVPIVATSVSLTWNGGLKGKAEVLNV